jgi:hypothetical protein
LDNELDVETLGVFLSGPSHSILELLDVARMMLTFQAHPQFVKLLNIEMLELPRPWKQCKDR